MVRQPRAFDVHQRGDRDPTAGTTWDMRPAGEPPRGAWVALVVGERRDVIALPADTEVSIGRSRSSGIPIPDPAVSRLHASLCWDGAERVTVTDHASRNGIFLRGRRVRERAQMTNGDELTVGPARLIVVVPSIEREPAKHTLSVDPNMCRSVELADRAAQSDLPVLIVGETGVGKELLARRIHEQSKRAEGAFVAVNCGSIAESLAEATLFGHERGAFTGAEARRAGLFEAGHGGTLFLDEVGELSVTTQARLLRVLEEKKVTRVGATRPVDVDVRVVSATHRDLDRMVHEGMFRQDLLYRLDVLRIRVPPLRERPDDIVWLAERFLAEHGPLRVDAPAKERLRQHAWPGNVRELRNAVARAAALRQTDVLGPDDFELADAPGGGGALRGRVADAEREAIVAALDACGGNQTQAARRLGVSRRALIYKMEKHRLKPLPPSLRDDD